MIKPMRLNKGDTIGIISPCIALTPEYIEKSVQVLQSKGFRVKFAKNVFSNSHGFAASPEERADDFNEMIADDTIKMLLFGGGKYATKYCHMWISILQESTRKLCAATATAQRC